MDLLIHRCVYAVGEMLLTDHVVFVVVVVSKRGFVLEDSIVYDVGKVERFDVTLDADRLAVGCDSKFDSCMCRVLVGPKSVDLLYVW